jgi:hypothetical protein
MPSLLNFEESYTFSRIFDLKIDPEDLAREFGYSFNRSQLNLLQYNGAIDRLADLRFRIDSLLPYVSLSSETSRREVLISQILFEVVQVTKAKKQDLDYGMSQLFAEMIALDQWDRSPDQPKLLGRVIS